MTDTNDLVLTIDVGSSSLRTNLFTFQAERLPAFEHQLPYEVRTTSDGGVEIDPQILLNCLFSAIDWTLQRARAAGVAGNIRAVGMCSLVSNVLGVASDGTPTTPIYTWADTRCASEAADLRSLHDEATIRERTGCLIHSSYLPARLLWLKNALPDAYARTTRWITLGDWVYLNIFGRSAQSLSVASWSGLLNRHKLTWDEDWLLLLDLGVDHLPPLVDVDFAFTGLHSLYVARWPELSNVPWYPCVADGAASNLGSGCYTADTIAVQVGTSSALRALVPDPPGIGTIPEGLWCYRLDHQTALVGGALSEGGSLFAWLRNVLKIEDYAALEEEAMHMAPDSHGLTILPFLAGERSLGWHDSARATISGLSLDTRPAHLFRAAQEAIAYRLAQVHDRLCEALPSTNLIVASGGALLGAPGWIAMLADVLGRPITASAEPEASSKGVALLALRSLGILSDFSQILPALGKTYTPDMQRHAIYRQAMQRQQLLYSALLDE